MKKTLFLLLFLLFLSSIIYHLSSKLAFSQPPECKTPEAEIMPRCVVCGNVLFCFGNSPVYRVCENEPGLPQMCPRDCPAFDPNCPNWYCTADRFPSGTVLYNGVTYNVPSGGVYVCDSNVYGCNNPSCKGEDGDEDGPVVPVGPVELNTSPSLICADFTAEGKKVTEEPEVTPPPEGDAQVLGTTEGSIKLNEVSSPDYSMFEPVARGALPALLPRYFLDPQNPRSLNIPQGTLPINIKHHVSGQSDDEARDPNKRVSKTKTDLSFVPFLASNQVLAALLKPGESAYSLNYTLPEVTPDVVLPDTACVEAGKTLSTDLPDPTNINPNFSVSFFENIIDIIRGIIKKLISAEVEVKSRGDLPGAGALKKNSGFADGYLPKEFVPEENASSEQEGNYEVSLGWLGTEESSQEVKYQGQKAVHDRYCQMLCSVYPAKFKPKDCECE